VRLPAAAAVLALLAAAALAGRAGGAGGAAPQVGLVVPEGAIEHGGAGRLAYEGLRRAELELGVSGRVLEAGSAAETSRALSDLAAHGFGLVVAVGSEAARPLADAARRFPQTSFAAVGVDSRGLAGRPRNALGLVFAWQQAGYLAGYLAALAERRLGGTAVGAVGGERTPALARVLAGYRAGARAAARRVRVLVDVAGEGAGRGRCRALARAQIGRGAGVVLGVDGRCALGVLEAARARRAWGIAADGDWPGLGPTVLASGLERADTAVLAAARAFVRGSFRGGRTLVLDAAQGGVRLGAVSPRAARADVRAAQRVERRLAAGRP